MSLGLDFAESPQGDFLESYLGDRTLRRPVGIYSVVIDLFVPTEINPSAASCLAVAAGVLAELRSLPFPVRPGVRWRSWVGNSNTVMEWGAPAVSIGGSVFAAVAFNTYSSSPFGVIRSTSGIDWAFINPCCPSVRIDRAQRSVEVKASKSLLVFGGQNGGGSTIGFCVPRPATGRVCVFDSVHQISGFSYLVESGCTIDDVVAQGGVAGRVEVGRRITLGPPSLGTGALNPLSIITTGDPIAPQWIRRMFAPDIPHMPDGLSSWPPILPAACCNLE